MEGVGGLMMARMEEPGIFVQDLEFARIIGLRLNGRFGFVDGNRGWAKFEGSLERSVRSEVQMLESVERDYGLCWNLSLRCHQALLSLEIFDHCFNSFDSKSWLQPEIHLIPQRVVGPRVDPKPAPVLPMYYSVRISHEAPLLWLDVALALPDGPLTQILCQMMMPAVQGARVLGAVVSLMLLVVWLVVLDQHGLVLKGQPRRSLVPAVAVDHACRRVCHSDEFRVAHVCDVAVNIISFEKTIVVFGGEQLVLVVQLVFLGLREAFFALLALKGGVGRRLEGWNFAPLPSERLRTFVALRLQP